MQAIIHSERPLFIKCPMTNSLPNFHNGFISKKRKPRTSEPSEKEIIFLKWQVRTYIILKQKRYPRCLPRRNRTTSTGNNK